MLVQDVLDLVKIKISNLNIAKKDDSLIKMMYLGAVDLYSRFNLGIKSETLRINTDLTLYELRNPDVSLIINVYDREGKELRQSDTINGNIWDYKIINYRSFILKKPFDGLLYAVYKCSPPRFSKWTDNIDLPDAMINALVLFVAYLANNPIADSPLNNNNSRVIVSTLYEEYLRACEMLEMQGYKVPMLAETYDVQRKGFV